MCASPTNTAPHRGDPEPTSLRIDLWLHRARFAKTRAAATEAVNGGKVRLTRNGQTVRLARASSLVRIGDILSIATARGVITLIIGALPARRGPSAEAATSCTRLGDQGSSENP